MCKEGIRIGRVANNQPFSKVAPAGGVVQLVGGRAGRITLTVVGQFNGETPTITGNVTDVGTTTTGSVDTTLTANNVAVATSGNTQTYNLTMTTGLPQALLIGTYDGTTFQPFAAVSPAIPSIVLPIERYGQLLLGPIFAKAVSGFGIQADGTDVFLIQDLGSL